LSTNPINIFIIANRSNIAFNDDLLKNIAGEPLLNYSIESAQNIVNNFALTIVTNCENIHLFARRKGVNTIVEKDKTDNYLIDINYFLGIAKGIEDSIPILFISPYSPLIKPHHYRKALEKFNDSKSDILLPVRYEYSNLIDKNSNIDDSQIVLNKALYKHIVQINGFAITSKNGLYKKNNNKKIKIKKYFLDSKIIEINGYRDWWICEKLLLRKRIVFRVLGNKKEGTGHIYRALTLAHEIVDHEIIFVTEPHNDLVKNKLSEYTYKLHVFNPDNIENKIIKLRPHLVVNDFLNTSKTYIQKLKSNGIKTINFEDLGSGASKANKTINELYDKPIINSKNILWGHKYSFLRDEFNGAKINQFQENVRKLLITFGGTDPNNYTHQVMHLIHDYCKENKISIVIVSGAGYKYIKELEKILKDYSNVKFYHSLGIMSEIMEDCQIAISSNGRTVYELAHMHIPTIILSHHHREDTHNYAVEDNGFIPLGIFNKRKENALMKSLSLLVEDSQYRKQLFNRMKKVDFIDNKKRVLEIFDEILND